MQTVITFEDLYEYGKQMGALPEGYAGLRWSNEACFLTKEFRGAVATANRVGLFNTHGRDISIESERPFDLVGLSLCSLWTDFVSIDLEGWQESMIKYATTIPVRQGVATVLSPGWSNIEQLQFRTGGKHFVVNYITIDLG